MLKPPAGYESARKSGSPEERKAALTRLLAEFRALLNAQAESANSQQQDFRSERESIEQRLQEMTKGGTAYLDENQEETYRTLMARVEELDKLETVAGELYDRADLALNTEENPDGPKRDDATAKPLTDD